MVGKQMTTSDIVKALNREVSWEVFCKKYKFQRDTFSNITDGIISSTDLLMDFELIPLTISKSHIYDLCGLEKDGLNVVDIQFIATVIQLCDFSFDSDETEDALQYISELENMYDLSDVINNNLSDHP